MFIFNFGFGSLVQIVDFHQPDTPAPVSSLHNRGVIPGGIVAMSADSCELLG